MSDQQFIGWIELRPGAKSIPYYELPHLMAQAIHGSDKGLAYTAACVEFERTLPDEALARTLKVRNALTLDLHDLPIGDGLRRSVILVDDLRAYLSTKSIGVRVMRRFVSAPRPRSIDADLLALDPSESVEVVERFGTRDVTYQINAAAYVAHLNERMELQAAGWFTINEAAQIIADERPEIDAKQLARKIRAARLCDKTILRSPGDKLPLTDFTGEAVAQALVKDSELNQWLRQEGTGYGFPLQNSKMREDGLVNLHGLLWDIAGELVSRNPEKRPQAGEENSLRANVTNGVAVNEELLPWVNEALQKRIVDPLRVLALQPSPTPPSFSSVAELRDWLLTQEDAARLRIRLLWMSCERWSSYQAAHLLCGIEPTDEPPKELPDPAYWPEEDHRLSEMRERLKGTRPEVGAMLERLIEADRQQALSFPAPVGQVIPWALYRQIPVPHVLRDGRQRMYGLREGRRAFEMRCTLNKFAEEVIDDKLKRQAEGWYTLVEVAERLRSDGAGYDSILSKLKDAAAAHELPMYLPGKTDKIRYGDGDGMVSKVRDRHEHARWGDLNWWLERNEPHINFRFPRPKSPGVSPYLAEIDDGKDHHLIGMIAGAIARREHPTDYLSEAGMAQYLEDDLRRAIHAGHLRAYSPRLRGYWSPPSTEQILWVKDADADKWFEEQVRPYRVHENVTVPAEIRANSEPAVATVEQTESEVQAGQAPASEESPAAKVASVITTNGAPRAAWRLGIAALLPALEKELGRMANVNEVIKHLKSNGAAYRIEPDGGPGQLFWKTQMGDRRLIEKKTISTAISELRRNRTPA